LEAQKSIQDHLRVYAVNGSRQGSDAGVRVEIAYASVPYPVPLHARRVLLYDPLRVYEHGGRMYFTDYFSTLVIDPEAGLLSGNLSPDTLKDFGLHSFVHLLFTMAVFEMLRFKGLYYLHASALQDPEGRGFLISGNAGSGKTSLTLSLIQAGFKFLSDDTVFLRNSGERDIDVLGFARDFHLPEDLIESSEFLRRFRDLPDLDPRRRRKLLAADQWFSGSRLDRLTNPEVILFPSIKERTSDLEPVPMAEALTMLLPQSLSVNFHPAAAAPHLEALKRVVGHAKAFRFSAGPELKGDPEKARELVRKARDLAGAQKET